jgi:hypothetical protein
MTAMSTAITRQISHFYLVSTGVNLKKIPYVADFHLLILVVRSFDIEQREQV